MKRGKKALAILAIPLGLFLAAAMAAAGPRELPDQANERALEAVASHEHKEGAPDEVADIADSTDAEVVVNHGHCVSWAAHQANDDAFEGRDRGMLIAAVAQDEEAVSARVEEDGTPDESCTDAYDAAVTSASATSGQSAQQGGAEERGRSAEARSNVEKNQGRN